jgi:hypothetical protein
MEWVIIHLISRDQVYSVSEFEETVSLNNGSPTTGGSREGGGLSCTYKTIKLSLRTSPIRTVLALGFWWAIKGIDLQGFKVGH